MTTRTITVTVQSVGGANKYFLDGVQQDTLTLAEGGTYVFNWSAASGHPLRFSTTSDGTHSGGGTEYTTGVTKDDGNYLTTIQVASSAPTLYYYCQYHSGMGGQLNTEAANTWGLLSWDEGAWGSQNNISFAVTGVSSTTSVGAVTIDEDFLIGVGWGRGTWGNRVWNGIYSVIPTGVSVTSTIGSVTTKADVSISVTGVAVTSAVGGNTTTQGVEITPTGLSLTGSLGTVTFDGDAAVGVTGVAMTSVLGTAIVAPITLVDVTGVAATGSVGTVVLEMTGTVNVTGVAATGAVGSIVPVSGYDVTGVAATSAVGSPTEVTGGGTADNVTGVVLTSSVGSVIIIAWSEIDTGTPVTWTRITTAA